jgi:hypothetical protein
MRIVIDEGKFAVEATERSPIARTPPLRPA